MMMMFALSVVVMMTLALVMALRDLSSSWFANLSKSFLDCWNICFISIVGNGCCFSVQIKNNILNTILQILVKRNILQNLVATILTMQIHIQYYRLFVRLSLHS